MFLRFNTCSIIPFCFTSFVLSRLLQGWQASLLHLGHLNVRPFGGHLWRWVVRPVTSLDLRIPIFQFMPCPPNMASADLLAHRNRAYSRISPGKSFSLPPMPAASTVGRSFSLRTSQRCACLSSSYSLICRSCSSVPDFAVPLPSVPALRQTTLRLASASGRYPRAQGICTLWENSPVALPLKKK